MRFFYSSYTCDIFKLATCDIFTLATGDTITMTTCDSLKNTKHAKNNYFIDKKIIINNTAAVKQNFSSHSISKQLAFIPLRRTSSQYTLNFHKRKLNMAEQQGRGRVMNY